MADGGHITRQEAARELLARRNARQSFLAYCQYVAEREGLGEQPAKHHEFLCHILQSVADGEIQNVIIMLPPGSAKSTYATVRFPAWYLGRFKRRGVISASYNSTLAEHFGKKVRNLVSSPAHQAVFPDCSLSADTRAKGEWDTTEGGFYFAVGVGEGVTGRRGDLAIGDDLIKGRQDADSQTIRDKTWEWWKADLRTRLKPKTAARVLIGTRWHEDDPIGRILPENYAGENGIIRGRDGGEWYVINIPAEARAGDVLGRAPGEWLWPEWFSPAYWAAEKVAQGPRNWLSLYQQTPTAEDGTYFEKDWFRYYDQLPKDMTVYMSGDFAVTEGDGDFTELGVWGVDSLDNIYALDWWSGQTTSEVWIDRFVDLVKRWKPIGFVGEGGPIRRSVEPFLARAMRDHRAYTVLHWLTGGDKAANARAFQAYLANGRVYFPHTDWSARLRDQLLRFPNGKYDDAVDTCSLFGRHMQVTWAATPRPDPKPELKQVWGQAPTVADFLPKSKSKSW